MLALPVARRKCCSLVCSSFTLELLSPSQISCVARLRQQPSHIHRRRRWLLLCELGCKELAELFTGLETFAFGVSTGGFGVSGVSGFGASQAAAFSLVSDNVGEQVGGHGSRTSSDAMSVLSGDAGCESGNDSAATISHSSSTLQERVVGHGSSLSAPLAAARRRWLLPGKGL